MSLSRAQNIFMPANINSIVILRKFRRDWVRIFKSTFLNLLPTTMAAFAPLFSERCRYLSLLNWRRQASLFVLNFLFLCLWAEGLYFLLLQREQHVCMLQSTSVLLGKYRMSGLIAVCFSRIYSGNQNGTLSTQYSVETKKLVTSWKWGKMFCWFLELFWPPCLYFPVRETPKKKWVGVCGPLTAQNP